ncbi:MAG: hypothetical protein EKK56_00885 [Flavobacteriaceae bacterium]|nr:MAG: hypothetical protein EKK56_00885 [Flavobacteriaceae bacterium]
MKRSGGYEKYVTIFALVLAALVTVNNYIVYPYLHLLFPSIPLLKIPPMVEHILEYVIGGYFGVIGAKKIMGWVKRKKK